MYFFLRTCCYCVKAWLLGFWFYLSLLHCFAYITFFFCQGVLLLSLHKQNTALGICPSVACSDMWNVKPGPNHRSHFSVVLITVSLFCCLLTSPMLWILIREFLWSPEVSEWNWECLPCVGCTAGLPKQHTAGENFWRSWRSIFLHIALRKQRDTSDTRAQFLVA